MTVFTRNTPAFRIAPVHRGDDVQAVAGRELGDANRWPELVWLNELVWPYVTDDPARAGDGVIISGAFIKIPAPVGVPSRAGDTGQVFERDCVLADKRLQATDGGDIAIVTGSSNLVQQLTHRINTPRSQMRRHPSYGCMLYRILGRVNGEAQNLMATEYARSAILSDYRIKSVPQISVVAAGDAISVNARAMTIEGGHVDIIMGQEPGFPVPETGGGAGFGANYGNDWN